MRLIKISVLTVAHSIFYLALGIAQETKDDVRGFECGFIYEKTPKGKSGDASCSYSADKVFSSSSESFSAREHCKTKKIFGFEDIRLRVDLLTQQVTYDREEGLAPHAFEQMVAFYMQKDKISKEEAIRKASKKPAFNGTTTYSLFHFQKHRTSTSYDPITQTRLKDYKIAANYSVVFGFGSADSVYSIFIPENGDAILSKPSAMDDMS